MALLLLARILSALAHMPPPTATIPSYPARGGHNAKEPVSCSAWFVLQPIGTDQLACELGQSSPGGRRRFAADPDSLNSAAAASVSRRADSPKLNGTRADGGLSLDNRVQVCLGHRTPATTFESGALLDGERHMVDITLDLGGSL